MKKVLMALALMLCVVMTACGPTVEEILQKPSDRITPDNIEKLIACIEEVNVPAQEYIKAEEWSTLVDFVEANPGKFDLAGRSYAKLNTLSAEQLVDTDAQEIMAQFAEVMSQLASHQMLSAWLSKSVG